ncbi:MAG: TraB/GumN family protein [Verrucomicrobiaceae bacterium]|nr:TraB/GumN family protein [Verrucomicrobiaceae bacterium]
MMHFYRNLAFFLLAGCVSAASSALADEEGKTSIWRVTGKDGGGTVFLAGSIHMLTEEDHPLPRLFEQAYRASDELILEIASGDDPNVEAKTLSRGMYGKEGRISNDLSPEAYKRLRKFLSGTGLPADAMDGFRPWLAAMTLSVTEMMKLGARPELGVDNYFEAKAIRDRKPVRGLETVDFQVGIFAGVEKEIQEKMLLSTLSEMATLDEDFPRMVEAWRSGDVDAVGRIILESMKTVPELRRNVLDRRNQRWVKQISEIIKEGKTFMVVVGTGHMAGKKGLLKLFERRGFRVERWHGEKPEKKKGRFIPVGLEPSATAWFRH